MRIKKIFTIAIALSTCSASLFSTDEGNQIAQNSQKMMSPGDCSDMTQGEQDFASQLNDANSMMFCSKMTPVQRQRAMQMAGMQGPSGNPMSPDDAVQNVMKNSGGMPNNRGPRGSGACPVQ
jgi:hypothetical protein